MIPPDHKKGSLPSLALSTFGARLVSLVLAVTSGAIVARWLGPQGKGVVAVALLAPGLIGLLIDVGLSTSNAYFASKMGVKTLSSHAITIAMVSGLAGFTLFVAVTATGLAAEIFPGIPTPLLLLGAATLPLSVTAGYLAGILQGLHRINPMNVAQMIQSFTRLSLTLLLVVLMTLGPSGAVGASVGAAMVGLALILRLIKREGGSLRPRWEPETGKALIGFGVRGQVASVLTALTYRLDVVLLNLIVGPAAVGIYSVSFRLAELLWFMPDAVSFVLFPRVAEAAPKDLERVAPRALRWTLLTAVAGAAALAAVGRPAIGLVYSSVFLQAYRPMLILLPGAILLGGAKILAARVTGSGYPHYASVVAGSAALLTVILDVLLIPHYGMAGAAMASSATYSAGFFMTLYAVRRIARREATR